MAREPILDKILFSIVSLASQFYSEATREWARKTVEKADSGYLTKITPEEAEKGVSMSDGQTWHVPDGDNITILVGNQRQRGLGALVLAAKYRLKQYWAILLAPVILYLITMDRGQVISLSSLGIYFDLFGAIIVVRGLYRTPAEIDFQSRSIIPSSPAGDPVEKLVTAVETVDSMFGSALLVFGFSLQLFAISGILFTTALLLLALVLWLAIR